MIELKQITKIYNCKKRNEFKALSAVSTVINDGELCAVVGRSGSGKSTLLHIIGMLDTFSAGKYFLDKQDVSALSETSASRLRAYKFGFVKQDFALIEDYTALDNVMLPLYPIGARDKREKALAALERLKVSALSENEVSGLSGGEKQRVAIARAIVNDPKIILADEPTGALDSRTAADIMDVFGELNADGRTVIIVTHDKGIAAQCGRVIELSDGRIVN